METDMVSDGTASHVYIAVTYCRSHHLFFSSEGECSKTPSGVLMRGGVGKHTSTDGVTYIGEWHDDKVCICMCVYTTFSDACVLVFPLMLSLCASHRCMAEGPWSIPLVLYMKENSKTTCTTARGLTPSQMALLIKANFMRTGKEINNFSALVVSFL